MGVVQNDPIMAAFSTLVDAHKSYQENPKERGLQEKGVPETDVNTSNGSNLDGGKLVPCTEQDFDQSGEEEEVVCDDDDDIDVEQNSNVDQEDEEEVVPQSFLASSFKLTAKQQKRVDKIRSKQISKVEQKINNDDSTNIPSSSKTVPTPHGGRKMDWHAAKQAAEKVCEPKTKEVSAKSKSKTAASNWGQHDPMHMYYPQMGAGTDDQSQMMYLQQQMAALQQQQQMQMCMLMSNPYLMNNPYMSMMPHAMPYTGMHMNQTALNKKSRKKRNANVSLTAPRVPTRQDSGLSVDGDSEALMPKRRNSVSGAGGVESVDELGVGMRQIGLRKLIIIL